LPSKVKRDHKGKKTPPIIFKVFQVVIFELKIFFLERKIGSLNGDLSGIEVYFSCSHNRRKILQQD
jgi:hypothetical protein